MGSLDHKKPITWNNIRRLPKSYFMLAGLFVVGTFIGLVLHQQPPPNARSVATTTHDIQPKPKVFGIGLSRTGTRSMEEAMKLLGYEEDKILHGDTALGQFMHHPEVRPDLRGKYNHVDSTWNIPTAAYYQELYQAYPNAKFVLTVRNSKTWYTSLQNSQERLYYQWGCAIPERLQRLFEFVYGARDVKDNEEKYIAAFERHNQEVQEFFQDKPDQLLVMDLEQDTHNAWKKLCSFLKREDGPCAAPQGRLSSPAFPKVHTAKEEEAALSSPAKKKQCAPSILPSTTTTTAKYAYVTILCDPINDKEGDFLKMFLVLVANLREYDQESDIIAMVRGPMMQKQLLLLQQFGVTIIQVGDVGGTFEYIDPYTERLPRFPSRGYVTHHLSGCYIAKLNALRLLQYEKVLYLDSDMIFEQDPRFLLEEPTFTAFQGGIAPMNGGLYSMTPSQQAYVDFVDMFNSGAFDPKDGWFNYGPIVDWKDKRQMFDEWTFFCAHSDQGLVYYYYQELLKTAKINRMADDLYMHFAGVNKLVLKDPNVNFDTVKQRLREPAKHWFRLWNDVVSKKVDMQKFVSDSCELVPYVTPPAILSSPVSSLSTSTS